MEVEVEKITASFYDHTCERSNFCRNGEVWVKNDDRKRQDGSNNGASLRSHEENAMRKLSLLQPKHPPIARTVGT